MDNVAVLNKLENLQQLLEDNRALRSYIDGGCARETVDQLDEIREKIGTIPKAPTAVSCGVSLPLPSDYSAAAKAEKDKRRIIFFAVAAVAAVLLVIYFSSHNEALNFWCVLSIFATIGVGWFYKMSNDLHKTKEKELQESRKKYAGSMESFRKAMSCYEKEVEEGRNEYIQYNLRYYQYYPDFLDTLVGYEEKVQEAEKALEEHEMRIAECDLAAPEYFHLIPKIISMLKSGRADSYKEALNMAVEEERQDEIEAARREEEARRLMALEMQAEEERRHNMMVERQQAEHNRAMEQAEQDRNKIEKDRYQAEERARKEQARADSDARRNAYRQCAVCAKSSGCRNQGVPGCGAFVPKNH